jgi:uncharacterized protein (DUF2062 family)
LKSAIAGFLNSLKGLSPEALALILALGIVLGVFPVFGCPTLLCAMAAVSLRLNLAAIQLVNQVSSPLQLALLIPLGRAGAHILGGGSPNLGTGSPHFGAGNMIAALAGAAGNAVVGWFCLCVPLGIMLYVFLLFTLRCRRARLSAEMKSAA